MGCEMPWPAVHLWQAVVAWTGQRGGLRRRTGARGEVGQCVQRLGNCRGQHVMLAAVIVISDLGVEPGRQDGEHIWRG